MYFMISLVIIFVFFFTSICLTFFTFIQVQRKKKSKTKKMSKKIKYKQQVQKTKPLDVCFYPSYLLGLLSGLSIIFLSPFKLSSRNNVTSDKVNFRPGIDKTFFEKD